VISPRRTAEQSKIVISEHIRPDESFAVDEVGDELLAGLITKQDGFFLIN